MASSLSFAASDTSRSAAAISARVRSISTRIIESSVSSGASEDDIVSTCARAASVAAARASLSSLRSLRTMASVAGCCESCSSVRSSR